MAYLWSNNKDNHTLEGAYKNMDGLNIKVKTNDGFEGLLSLRPRSIVAI